MVQLLKQRRTLTEPEVRFFIYQAMQGVHYLHQQKIIHRDIKLGNLFITNDMDVRIGDFGLAVKLSTDGKKETYVTLLSKACNQNFEIRTIEREF